MQIGTLGDETDAGAIGGNVVVLFVGERLEVLGAGLNRGFLGIDAIGGVMGFNQTDVVEEKLVAPRRTELALFEQHPQLGRGSVIIVRENFDNERHFVGRVAFESDLFENQLLLAKTRTFFNGAFNDVAGDGIPAGLFNGGKKASIALGIAPPILAATEISFTSLPVAADLRLALT